MTVTIRPFNHDTDAGFVFSTWPKGAYYGAIDPIYKSKRVFFNEMYDHVQVMLETAHVMIACLSEASDTIIGYAIRSEDVLEWVYVKEDFRKQGVAILLWEMLGTPHRVRRTTIVGNAISAHSGLEEV